MALLLPRGAAVLPEQTSELVLSRSGREVSSLVMCPVAWCTCMVEAPVGQEGIGETHPRPGCHGRAIRALLVLAEPQPRRDVLHPLCDGPAPVVRLEPVGGRELRGMGDQPAALRGRPVPREDSMAAAPGADREPAGLDNAGAGAAVGLRDDAGLGAAPSQELAPLAPRLALPAELPAVAMAVERGGNMAALRSAGLDHGRTEIIGLTQAQDLDPGGGGDRPHAWSRHLGGLREGDTDGSPRRLLHIAPETPGEDGLSDEPRATDVVVAVARGVGRGGLQLGHRRHALPACGLLGIVEEQRHGVPRPGGQSPAPLLRLLPPGHFGVPALDQEDVGEAGPVGLGIQLAV
jgi:hypothetical protein